MIIEARCNICGKRFGYASLTGADWYHTSFMKTVQCREMLVEMLCDECREGRIDIDQTEPRGIEKAKMKEAECGCHRRWRAIISKLSFLKPEH